ncbi:MAG: YybH family protein [Cyclobacteriaceae bacterium]|jgi:ketosteroid isomerase-like protein|nr:nuclear transport factor 2 family protein [Flammeovirgaceae bacterium]
MRTLTTLLFLIFSVTLQAQSSQTEINTQVWKPFIQHFSDHNAKAFLALHSKDVVRSPRDAKTIWGYDEYLKNQLEGDAYEIKNNLKRTLELRFTERIAKGDNAIEVGIYKTVVTAPDGKQQFYFGRFHVVLKKINGTWKITVDTDYTENNTIGEKDFLAAKSMIE